MDNQKHEGLPVRGYTGQPQWKVDLVNQNKETEEIVLRKIDQHRNHADVDQRMVAIANTKIQEAFMWLNRSVFQPTRVALPDDPAPETP